MEWIFNNLSTPMTLGTLLAFMSVLCVFIFSKLPRETKKKIMLGLFFSGGDSEKCRDCEFRPSLAAYGELLKELEELKHRVSSLEVHKENTYQLAKRAIRHLESDTEPDVGTSVELLKVILAQDAHF